MITWAIPARASTSTLHATATGPVEEPDVEPAQDEIGGQCTADVAGAEDGHDRTRAAHIAASEIPLPGPPPR